MPPELHVEGDDGQQAEALRAAGERRPQPGGGEHQAEGGGGQWQGQDTNVRMTLWEGKMQIYMPQNYYIVVTTGLYRIYYRIITILGTTVLYHIYYRIITILGTTVP